MARRWVTPEVKAWLRENYPERTIEGTRQRLNRRFGLAVTYGQLRAANKNHRFGRCQTEPSLVFDAA